MMKVAPCRFSVAGLSILIVVLIVSCGVAPGRFRSASLQQDVSSPAAFATQERYYHEQLSPFGPLQYDTPGNSANHYQASCTGELLSTHYIGIHGVIDRLDQLNLRTGVITGSRSAVGPSAERGSFELLPPDRGGNWFRYLEELNNMAETLAAFPAATAAASFIAEAKQTIRALNNVDAINLTRWNYYNVLDNPLTVALDYKTSGPRDLLLTFCDRTACYARQRSTLADQQGSVNLSVALPGQIADMTSAYFTVRLVPQNGDGSFAFAEQRKDVAVEAFERVDCTLGYSIKAGATDTMFINYRTKALGATIAVKIFDRLGQVAFQVENSPVPASEALRMVAIDYTVAPGATLGKARVMVRVLGAHASWDHYLSECVSSTDIASL